MSDLDLSHDPDGLTFTWKQWGLICSLSRFKDASSGTSAELTVIAPIHGQPKVLTQGIVNLSALQTRDRLAQRLAKLYPDAQWDTIIETVCVRGIAEHRRGEPLDSLEPTDDDQPAHFILNPMLYHGHPTLLYGPGDSGKSFLALYWACLLASGGDSTGLSVRPGGHRCLILNWELRAPEMRSRVRQLRAAHPVLTASPLHRFCYLPLAEFAPDLRRELRTEQIDTVIIDSLALASGGEIERSESAIRFFAALSSLNVTSLVIGHVAKGLDDYSRTPYGSVFFFNLARSVWEVRKTQEEQDDTFKMALFHRKNNLGRRLAPVGYTVTVNSMEARVSQFDPQEEPEFATGLAAQTRIKALLKDGEARTCKQIAEELGIVETTVRKKLNEYKGKHWYCLTHGGGRGKESEWACLG